METSTDTGTAPVYSKKVQRGWAMFDWANSAFALVITVAIFPGYFTAQIDESVRILGMEFSNASLYSYAVSLSYLTLIIIIPLLSGIADGGGKRKFFMKLFTYLGAFASMSLFFFKGHHTVAIGVAGFALANIGFSGSLVFYNSYLPLISSANRMDKVSAMGYIFGYVGSIILLTACLILIMGAEGWGLDANLAIRISFLSVGIWWIGWAQIPFSVLPKDIPKPSQKGLVRQGIEELLSTFRQLKTMPNTRKFLLAFLFFNSGVQTVLYLAGPFAEEEMKFATQDLIILTLLLQVAAAIGAFFFSRISSKTGNKPSLMILIALWMVCCAMGFWVEDKSLFYFLAALVGLTMGGIQSLARATYGKLIENRKQDLTSFFSFYNVLQYISTMSGTFLFGLVSQLTGGMRYSILSLSIFFLIGGILLSRVDLSFLNKNPIND